MPAFKEVNSREWVGSRVRCDVDYRYNSRSPSTAFVARIGPGAYRKTGSLSENR
jgi:hypothetical protein